MKSGHFVVDFPRLFMVIWLAVCKSAFFSRKKWKKKRTVARLMCFLIFCNALVQKDKNVKMPNLFLCVNQKRQLLRSIGMLHLLVRPASKTWWWLFDRGGASQCIHIHTPWNTYTYTFKGIFNYTLCIISLLPYTLHILRIGHNSLADLFSCIWESDQEHPPKATPHNYRAVFTAGLWRPPACPLIPN